MPNLNGSNWVRQTPRFTHSQVEALKKLNQLNDLNLASALEGHEEWVSNYKPLNRKPLSDILYTLATGEYELDTDEHEQYLLERINHWHTKDTLLYHEMKKVLEEYRMYKEQIEE